MTKRNITRESFHYWLYYLCLCLLVISLPASRFMLTVSLIFLLGNWLLTPRLKARFNTFLSNKPAVIFSSIYLLNIIGLLWTKDFLFAYKNDLLHKLPTLFMPIIICSSPMLSKKNIRLLLFFFIASVLTVTFIGVTKMWLHPNLDFREASPFVPHIYLVMMLLVAALQLPLLVKQVSNKKLVLLGALIISVWLIYFIFYLRSFSGIASLIGISIFSLFYLANKYKNKLFMISLTVLFAFCIAFLLWLFVDMNQKVNKKNDVDFSTLPTYTEKGTSYLHDTTNYLRENGNLVYIFIAEKELGEAWNSKSPMDFYGNDKQNHPLRHTLYRYMSSKGLRKDDQAFSCLSDNDINAVENGITNYLYVDWPGLYIRVYETMMGLAIYRETSHQHSTWSTLTERLDLWNASWCAFKEHPLLGWGTGSILQSVNFGLEKNKSELLGRNMKPHNQYFYFLLTIGLVGLLLFVLLYLYVIVKTKTYNLFMFNVFIIVFAINFIANNSYESQVGQNFFVFFSLLYCFIYPQLNVNQEKNTDIL
jgi:hypothetical protein